jgi:hypothetical protein
MLWTVTQWLSECCVQTKSVMKPWNLFIIVNACCKTRPHGKLRLHGRQQETKNRLRFTPLISELLFYYELSSSIEVAQFLRCTFFLVLAETRAESAFPVCKDFYLMRVTEWWHSFNAVVTSWQALDFEATGINCMNCIGFHMSLILYVAGI